MSNTTFSRQITLPRNVRYFTKHGSLLARTDKGLSAGSIISTGDPESVVYDHRDQIAVPFLMDGKTYYMIVAEIWFEDFLS